MNDKELIWLPREMVKKLKTVEDNELLMEKEVIQYIDKTKRDISGQVELLDDDILMFKAKLVIYKKAFKEAYTSADEEMYSFWEDLDKNMSERYKSLNKRMSNVSRLFDREYDKRKHQIGQLSDQMKTLNTYQFENTINFLRSFESLGKETKDMFERIIKDSK